MMIDLDSVEFGYRRGMPVLCGINLRVERGRAVCIAGRNGAGKSTVLSLVLGKRSPWGGTVSVDGGDPTNWRTRARLGHVPQHSHFPPMATVSFVLRLVSACVPDRLSDRQLAELLERLGLDQRLRQRCGELSGGWLRRLSLACGLLGAPTMLVMDEPSAGLDEEGRGILLDLIAEHAARGGSLLWTTHDAQDVFAVDSDIALLKDGVLKPLGSLWEFTNKTGLVQLSILAPTSAPEVEGFIPRRQGRVATYEVPVHRQDAVIAALRHGGHDVRVSTVDANSALRQMLETEQ